MKFDKTRSENILLRGILVVVGTAVCIVTMFLPFAQPTIAANRPVLLRFAQGFQFEVPEGWGWTDFDGYKAVLLHKTTTRNAQGTETSPNRIEIEVRPKRQDNWAEPWTRTDQELNRSFPNGVTAQWKTGLQWDLHYTFLGYITLPTGVIEFLKLGNRVPEFDPALLEAAFLHVARTLQTVPKSESLYHPLQSFAVNRLPSHRWSARVTKGNIQFGCYTSYCGVGSNVRLFITEFPPGKSAREAVSSFATQMKLSAKVHLRSLPSGEVAWVEPIGHKFLRFLGVVQRGERYYVITSQSHGSVNPSSDLLREDFLTAASSVRHWDGR